MLIISLVLFQVLIFGGLIFILRRILTRNVISATQHLEELNQDYQKKEEELNRQLEEVKQQSKELLKKAQEEAEQIKWRAAKETESERNKIISQARAQGEEIIQQADKSRLSLLSEIEERIDKEAINKACELIQNSLPEQFKQNVHARWIEELIEGGFGGLEHLRIPEDVQEIKITCAFSLDADQRQAVLKKMNDIFGREITLKEEIDPKVVAGLIISIGSLVLDGSLRNKIKEQTKSG